MIYLDNAATSFPKAPGVGQATMDFIANDAANPGRAGHRMAVAAEQMLDALRLKLTRLCNGADHERMVFTMNGTDALNIANQGRGGCLFRKRRRAARGDHGAGTQLGQSPAAGSWPTRAR